MPIYVLVFPKDAKVSVTDNFEDQDYCELIEDVWAVWSSEKTTSEVAKKLNLQANRSGIVVATKNFSGFAQGEVVEKLSNWEARDAS